MVMLISFKASISLQIYIKYKSQIINNNQMFMNQKPKFIDQNKLEPLKLGLKRMMPQIFPSSQPFKIKNQEKKMFDSLEHKRVNTIEIKPSYSQDKCFFLGKHKLMSRKNFGHNQKEHVNLQGNYQNPIQRSEALLLLREALKSLKHSQKIIQFYIHHLGISKYGDIVVKVQENNHSNKKMDFFKKNKDQSKDFAGAMRVIEKMKNFLNPHLDDFVNYFKFYVEHRNISPNISQIISLITIYSKCEKIKIPEKLSLTTVSYLLTKKVQLTSQSKDIQEINSHKDKTIKDKKNNQNRLLKKHVFARHKRISSLGVEKVHQNQEYLKQKNTNTINQNSSGLLFTIQEKSDKTQSSLNQINQKKISPKNQKIKFLLQKKNSLQTTDYERKSRKYYPLQYQSLKSLDMKKQCQMIKKVHKKQDKHQNDILEQPEHRQEEEFLKILKKIKSTGVNIRQSFYIPKKCPEEQQQKQPISSFFSERRSNQFIERPPFKKIIKKLTLKEY